MYCVRRPSASRPNQQVLATQCLVRLPRPKYIRFTIFGVFKIEFSLGALSYSSTEHLYFVHKDFLSHTFSPKLLLRLESTKLSFLKFVLYASRQELFVSHIFFRIFPVVINMVRKAEFFEVCILRVNIKDFLFHTFSPKLSLLL